MTPAEALVSNRGFASLTPLALAAVARQGLTAKATERAEDLRDVVEAALAEAMPITKLAEHLNSLSCTTPRGSAWTTPAIYRLLARLGLHQPKTR